MNVWREEAFALQLIVSWWCRISQMATETHPRITCSLIRCAACCYKGLEQRGKIHNIFSTYVTVCRSLCCAVWFRQNSCSCQQGQCLLLLCFDRYSAPKWAVTAVILTGPCKNSCQCTCAVLCWGPFFLPVWCWWDPSRHGAQREATASCLPVFKSHTRASLPPVFCSSLFPNPPLYSGKSHGVEQMEMHLSPLF